MEHKKRCNNCKEEKLLTEFYKKSSTTNSYQNECKKCESTRRKKRRQEEAPSKTFPLLPFDPKSREWQNGKPFGGIKKTEVGYKIKYVTPKGNTKTKSFSFKKNPDKEKCFLLAYNYLLTESNRYNKTGNKVRMTDEGHLEVSLTQNRILLIDYEHLDLVQAYRISVTNKGYAQFYINSNQVTVQTLLTGFEVTDHDNRERLDCRMSNLLESSDFDNNHNLGMSSSNSSGITGVMFSKDRDTYYWKAYFQYDGVVQERAFSVNKHTYMGALEKALQKRLEWLSATDSVNGLDPKNLDVLVNKEKLLETADKYLDSVEGSDETTIEKAREAKQMILQVLDTGVSIEKAIPLLQPKKLVLKILKPSISISNGDTEESV